MKLKIYAVSLMALHRIEAKAPGEDNLLYWEHSACLISSDTVEHASYQAKEIAFNSWPSNQGWSMHSASITPITSQYYNFMQMMMAEGHLTGEHVPDESPGFFRFDTETSDFKQGISLKGH